MPHLHFPTSYRLFAAALGLAFLPFHCIAQSITFGADSWPEEVTTVIVTYNGDTILNVGGIDLWPNGAFTAYTYSVSTYGAGLYSVYVNDTFGDGGTSVVVDGGPFSCSGSCSGSVSGSGSTFVFTLTGELPGCTQQEAVNYNPFANIDDGTCIYPGCQDLIACNYLPEATLDDGSCLVPSEEQSCCSSGLFFSEFAEGPASDTYLELYNASADTINLSTYLIARTANQLNPAGGFDFEDVVFTPTEHDLPPGQTFLVVESNAAPSLLALSNITVPEISSGDDALGLIRIADGLVVDQIGVPGTDEGLGWSVAGEVDATYNSTIIRKSTVSDGNGADWLASAGLDSESSEWIVLSEFDASDAGQHDQDGLCAGESPFITRGCGNPLSCNYDENVNALVSAMCDFESCYGCMEVEACNFDGSATLQGTEDCLYPVDLFGLESVDCDGNCYNDSDGDGVCNEEEPIGCTNIDACNYDVVAEFDDGSCEYVTCAGCTDPLACDYVVGATFDTGCDYSCVTGCTDSLACNFEPQFVVDDGTCDYSCVTGCTDPFACNYEASNVIEDNSCEFSSCLGCTDPDACNFDSAAIYDNGSCSYNDANGNGICDDLDPFGCLDSLACNYSETATITDSTCLYPTSEFVDCDGFCLTDADFDGICDELEIQGCTDTLACNFNPLATLDFGCYWPSGYFECNGGCLNDTNADGICDEEDAWANSCGQTIVIPDTLILGCGDSCVSIVPGAFPFLNTDSYSVSEMGYSPPLPQGTGTVQPTPNNGFTNEIGLPFGFSFFDTDFFSLKVSRKGFLTFNTGLTGTYNYPNQALGSSSLPANSIMAPYAYISNSGGEIRTATTGEYPCRRFVVSWENLPQTGCGDNELVTQIVLFEGTNQVEMHIGQFEACIGITACVGIQGGSGEGAFGPDEYDTGEIVLNQKSFRYLPSGEPLGEFQFSDSTGWIGQGDSLHYCGGGSQVVVRAVVPEIVPPTPVVGTCSEIPDSACDTVMAYDFNLNANQTGSFNFPFDGELLGIAVTNNWSPSGGSWPGDMSMSICDPSGNCGVIEGFSYDLPGTIIGDWPFEWNTTSSSFYESCFYIQEGLLSGSGNWSLNVQNAWGGSLPGTNFQGTVTLFWSCESESVDPPVLGATLASAVHLIYNPGGDSDGDGICDADEISGCTNEEYTNYDPEATDDDGSCFLAGCTDPEANNYSNLATVEDGTCLYGPVSLVVETYAENIGVVGSVDLTGYSTYRLYVAFDSPNDFLTAVYGDSEYPTLIQGGDNFFQAELGGFSNEQYNPIIFPAFPDLEYDSFVTIGMSSPANSGNGEAPINAVGDPMSNWIPSFEPGAGQSGSDIIINTQTGGAWFPSFSDANGYAGDDLLVLIGQFTTNGLFSGVVSVAYFEEGNQDGSELVTLPFISDPDAVYGCTAPLACNYDEEATEDDGSCLLPGNCQSCNGSVLVTFDEDQDGICDDDEVLGCTDAEAVNYDPQATDDSGGCQYAGCTDVDALNFDGEASVDDGSCEYLLTGLLGCTYASASNYDAQANIDDGSCAFPGCMDAEALNYNAYATEEGGECIYLDDVLAGECIADLDNSGYIGSADLIIFLTYYELYCE